MKHTESRIHKQVVSNDISFHALQIFVTGLSEQNLRFERGRKNGV